VLMPVTHIPETCTRKLVPSFWYVCHAIWYQFFHIHNANKKQTTAVTFSDQSDVSHYYDHVVDCSIEWNMFYLVPLPEVRVPGKTGSLPASGTG